MARPKSKKPTGNTRMKQLGYKQIQMWVDPEELVILQTAANSEGRPLSRFILRAALLAAKQLQSKSQ